MELTLTSSQIKNRNEKIKNQNLTAMNSKETKVANCNSGRDRSEQSKINNKTKLKKINKLGEKNRKLRNYQM